VCSKLAQLNNEGGSNNKKIKVKRENKQKVQIMWE
jgi:hypothetical protein